MRRNWSEVKKELASMQVDDMVIVHETNERQLKAVTRLRHWKNRPNFVFRMVTGDNKVYVIRTA